VRWCSVGSSVASEAGASSGPAVIAGPFAPVPAITSPLAARPPNPRSLRLPTALTAWFSGVFAIPESSCPRNVLGCIAMTLSRFDSGVGRRPSFVAALRTSQDRSRPIPRGENGSCKRANAFSLPGFQRGQFFSDVRAAALDRSFTRGLALRCVLVRVFGFGRRGRGANLKRWIRQDPNRPSNRAEFPEGRAGEGRSRSFWGDRMASRFSEEGRPAMPPPPFRPLCAQLWASWTKRPFSHALERNPALLYTME
jgi:hypothetical protein